MVDLAKQAFNTNNFDLAAEIYERNIRENGPSQEIYLGLADSYARSGDLKKAFESYGAAFRLGYISPDQLNHLVTALINIMSEKEAQRQEQMPPKDDNDTLFSCDICKAMWNQPISMNCGHTFCRPCLEKTQPKACPKCKQVYHYTRVSNLRTSVLLQTTIDKWFPDELASAKLKSEGNKLFQQRKFDKAIEIYTKAFSHGKHWVQGIILCLILRGIWF